MRTLSFIVEGQILKPDPECDFSGIVPGTEKYLQAKFKFSDEWKNAVKVAGFWSRLGEEYPPQKLRDGNKCVIPAEALKSKYFKIRVIGKRKDGFRLMTNKLEICQNGG